jgi:acyl-CoA reductase-like NAD-dependent aldehyde dehydrogenase
MPAVIDRDVKLFTHGRLTDSKSARRGPVFNPSTGEQIAEVPFCSTQETESIIQAAHALPVGEGLRAGNAERHHARPR